MIGGEFDLSAGVMIGSSGLLLGYLTTFQDMNVWPAIALVLVFGLVVGFLNGITVVKTMLPSFIVTLATFFVLQGVNAALTLRLTGTTAIGNIDTVAGFESARRFLASEITQWDFKVKVLWWIGLTIVGAWCSRSPASETGSSAPAATRSRPETWACRLPARRSRSSWPPRRPRL